MNKNIKKIIKQATEDVMRNTPSFLVTNEMWQEKFAELIVRECAEYAEHELDMAGYKKKFMLKHFGV